MGDIGEIEGRSREVEGGLFPLWPHIECSFSVESAASVHFGRGVELR